MARRSRSHCPTFSTSRRESNSKRAQKLLTIWIWAIWLQHNSRKYTARENRKLVSQETMGSVVRGPKCVTT